MVLDLSHKNGLLALNCSILSSGIQLIFTGKAFGGLTLFVVRNTKAVASLNYSVKARYSINSRYAECGFHCNKILY